MCVTVRSVSAYDLQAHPPVGALTSFTTHLSTDFRLMKGFESDQPAASHVPMQAAGAQGTTISK